jgi:hypothetical protein
MWLREMSRLYLVLPLLVMFLPRQDLWAQQTPPNSIPSPETLLVMYGCCDKTSFPKGDVWPDMETWKEHWELVFSRFTVITGKTEDASLVQGLRSKGILFAYHVVNTVGASPQDSLEERTNALVEEWSRPFENSLEGQLPGGFDAISIDEFRANPDGSAEAAIVAHALREVHRLYPKKKIIVWGSYQLGLSGSCGIYGLWQLKGACFDVQLQALQETGSVFIVENYVREGKPQFSLYDEIGRNLSKRYPPLFQRTIFGVAISQTAPYIYDDRPRQDFSDFIEKQLRHIRTNQILKRMPGVAFWAFYRAKPVTIVRLVQTIDKWFMKRE